MDEQIDAERPAVRLCSKEVEVMRVFPLLLAIAMGALGATSALATQAATATPAGSRTVPVAAETEPLPTLQAAKALPRARILSLASRTLIGQQRKLDYGFSLLLPLALSGDRDAIRLLAKAIDANEYGFGGQTDRVLGVLANEAMRGSTGSIIAWATIHDRGIDVSKDATKAYQWYRWAAVVGSDTGKLLTALALVQGKGVAPDKGQAVQWAGRISPARRGDAYLELAKVLYLGPAQIRDPDLARDMALKSAELDKTGRVDAAQLLAKHATDSATVTQALQIIKDAAKAGDAKAQFYIASLDSDPDSMQNLSTDDLYARLAAAGDDQAMKALARSLSRSGGSPADLSKILGILEIGADHGSVEAMRALSGAYLYGIGTDVSFKTAISYYQRAADAGDAESEYQLGLMYANAIGVNRDVDQARYWLTKSAGQGYALASATLNMLAQR
ncbi:MAG TPA: tetratricopeptide repeat protein [Devosiaceae bacterium]|nr:tetratricopeptide repeat protein [Devosiaceae bacterium]